MLKFRWETEFKKTEIGEIPKDWEVRKLGEVVEVEWGNTTLTKKIYRTEGYPVFSATGQDGYADFYEREGEAVIVSAIGAYCGVCFYAKDKWTAIKNTLVLQSKKAPCSIKFLFYFLNDKEKWPELGSGQPFISKSAAEEVLIVYPPLPEQARIATVLSWFDDLIEVKKKQNEILEKTAMAIFKNWFIDFEPFKNEEFVYNEELGREIPKGWEVKKLISVSSIISGRGRYLIEAKEGSYPLWGANGILGYIDNYDLEGFSIITGRVGTLGNIFLVEGKFAISDNVLCITPNHVNLTFFLYLWIKLQLDFEALNVGTSQPLITKTALGNKPIIFPPPHILQSFHSLVEPLFQKIILNQKQIMTLRKIKDTLLPLLVFGKLRVEEM